MEATRAILSSAPAAAAMCALLALPARLLGLEVARAFRRAIDTAVSRVDVVFQLVTHSDTAYEVARQIQAWGAWVIFGLVTGIIAMTLTRLLAGRPQSMAVVVMVAVVWAAIRALLWTWDTDLQFALKPATIGGLAMVYGTWPYAGSIGFLASFTGGLALAAAAWKGNAKERAAEER